MAVLFSVRLSEKETDAELQGNEFRVGDAVHPNVGLAEVPLASADLLAPFYMESDAEILGNVPVEGESDASVSLRTLLHIEGTGRCQVIGDRDEVGIQCLEVVYMETVEGYAC